MHANSYADEQEAAAQRLLAKAHADEEEAQELPYETAAYRTVQSHALRYRRMARARMADAQRNRQDAK